MKAPRQDELGNYRKRHLSADCYQLRKGSLLPEQLKSMSISGTWLRIYKYTLVVKCEKLKQLQLLYSVIFRKRI